MSMNAFDVLMSETHKGNCNASRRAAECATANTYKDEADSTGTLLPKHVCKKFTRIEDMFSHMVSQTRADLIQELSTLRPLRGLFRATMCSGTESPLWRSNIGSACHKLHHAPLLVEHVFSCEIEPFKQAYIERNFAPPILFRDVRELGNAEATTAYGAKVPVPGGVDMLVAGTSCVDYSNLNNEKKDLEEQGESGQTFRGMMSWVTKHRPPRVVLENVCSAPWDKVKQRFRQQQYPAEFLRLDTKQFHPPHQDTG